jgi:hypothetical protein
MLCGFNFFIFSYKLSLFFMRLWGKSGKFSYLCMVMQHV